MPMRITGRTTVRELVAHHPATRAVFERLGIDYCCGGASDLNSAAQRHGVELPALLAALRQALAAPAAEQTPPACRAGSSASELIDHILARHHTFTRHVLAELGELMPRVLRAHSARHGTVLAAVAKELEAMTIKLLHHLEYEEEVLFPMVRDLEALAAGRQTGRPAAEVGTSIRHLQTEHVEAGAALDRLRKMTAGYAAPPDACPSFTALYERLAALERDLHEHIHLENNLLFPRALALEKAAGIA